MMLKHESRVFELWVVKKFELGDPLFLNATYYKYVF